MIDPLVQLPQRLTLSRPQLRNLLPKLFSVLVQGGRYRIADLALFRDRGVFSRFHLVPCRNELRLLGAEAVIVRHHIADVVGVRRRVVGSATPFQGMTQ